MSPSCSPNPANPLFERINTALPQTQCTRCGFADCAAYAHAIACGIAPINQCPPGGAEGVRKLAALTGLPELPLSEAHGIEAQGDMAGGVGAVDDAEDAALARHADRRFDRKDQCRGRSDVAEEQHPGAVGHAGQDGLGEGCFRHQRHGHLDGDDLRTGAAGDIGPGLFEGGIFVIGGQDLVAGLQIERLGDDVESLGGIDQPDDIVGPGTEEGRERDARCPHPRREVASEEGDGLALELKLEVLVGFEHRSRAGAERAMVEKDDILAK